MAERFRILIGVMVAFAMPLLASCTYPLKSNSPTSVSETAGKPLTEDRVKAAVLAAGRQTPIQWDMDEVKPGLIRAYLDYSNKHKITIDILYSANSYQLVYVTVD